MLKWPVHAEIVILIETLKEKYHPRLAEAKVAARFDDSKPFLGDRFNFGNTRKFSTDDKMWHPENKRYDFLITICADAWHGILDASQREALLDLRLSCCQVEYVPNMIEENGKKKPVKDEWGRVQYSNEIKRDADGLPKWKAVKADLSIFQSNVSRFGLWCSDLLDFSTVIQNHKG